jgi:hypothetical protein
MPDVMRDTLRSINENPKLNKPVALQLGAKSGWVTDLWRKMTRKFYLSIIPECIGEDKRLWLTTPEEMSDFIENLRKPEYDVSNIKTVCIHDTISDIYDIIEFFSLLYKKLPDDARLMYSNYNWKLFPIFWLSALVGFSRMRSYMNFLRDKDLDDFAEMSGWENIRKTYLYLLPFDIPVLGFIFNGFMARLPILRLFTLNTTFVARKRNVSMAEDVSVSILIPCKNEEYNVEAAVRRTPTFGKSLEMVFINDKSTDTTEAVINECMEKYPDKDIRLVQGMGRGKGEAVREGMKSATGDICMILDADLTIIPEDLPQFYEVMKSRAFDFIHGTRLVYPQENKAMRFANIIGNVGFSVIFSYILEQRTTDTLCGTKVFWLKDWPLFEETRKLLKYSDLWGDYNLIFGAAHFNLKIGQLPVRYFERLVGITKMNKRIRNGLVMLRVAWYALWEIKFKY